MEWKEWIGKNVFIRTKHDKVYSGEVKSVDDSDKLIVFLNLQDKYGQPVTIVHSEIVEVKEEKI